MDRHSTRKPISYSTTTPGHGARNPLPLRYPSTTVSTPPNRLLLWTTPSRIQRPQEPIMFAIMMSVNKRSPTMAICEGWVTPVAGSERKKPRMEGWQPGFFVVWVRTGRASVRERWVAWGAR